MLAELNSIAVGLAILRPAAVEKAWRAPF